MAQVTNTSASGVDVPLYGLVFEPGQTVEVADDLAETLSWPLQVVTAPAVPEPAPVVTAPAVTGPAPIDTPASPVVAAPTDTPAAPAGGTAQ